MFPTNRTAAEGQHSNILAFIDIKYIIRDMILDISTFKTK